VTRPHSSPSSPRLLLVSEPASAGVASCVRTLAGAASAELGKVTVVTSHGQLPSELSAAGIPTIAIASRTRAGWISAARSLVKEQSTQYDVIHLHSTFAGVAGRLGVAHDPCVVYSPHAWSFYRGGKFSRTYTAMERLLASRTDRFVLASMAEMRSLAEVHPGAIERAEVIPNGVDTDRFRPPRAGTCKDIDILCVGRLCRQKGQDLLLRAIGHVAPSANVVLVGTGPDRRNLANLAIELGLENCRFVGQVGDVRGYYERARVCAFPSRWDGMSLALLEALACGSATLASDVAGTDEFDSALLRVESDSVDALARGLQRLLDSAELCQRLGAAARCKIEAEYSLTSYIARHLSMWRAAADS